MKKSIKLFFAIAISVIFVFALVACGDSDESKATIDEAGFDLPVDEFSDLTENDRIKRIIEDIDALKKLQDEGVKTDDQKKQYDEVVADLEKYAPEFKEELDKGKQDHKIDTDKLKEQAEKESQEAATTEAQPTSSDSGQSATDPSNASTEESTDYSTLPYAGSEIELPTIRFK